ncbi:EamA family transporter [Bacillus xiapuensis]|uniref:EamA family transporter n=1 Tax=Bacillus xiapuensis TaxID=2014075 RepID=UPI000C2340C4|nr:DMT family transporter [Bacillus xiapuensis]
MNQLRYSLFVLIGACSYGIQGSLIKLATNAGFKAEEITAAQYFFGLLLVLLVVLFAKRVKLNIKQTASLLALGVLLSLTGVFYSTSIEQLTASVSIILLFQFTWIGILIEAVYLRKFPSNLKIISVILLWAGTVLAGGAGSDNITALFNGKGAVFGILAAVTFSLFLFFSGKAGKGVPTIQRSLVTTAGGLMTVLLVASPAAITEGITTGAFWKYGLLVGLFGVVIPIVFFAVGTPHIDSGTATILGAAELPAAIIAAMLILGEQMTLAQMAGIILILIGIVVPQWRPRKKAHSRHLSVH